MRRYSLPSSVIAPTLMRETEDGEWVNWADLSVLVDVSGTIALRHDHFLQALRQIAEMEDSPAATLAREVLGA